MSRAGQGSGWAPALRIAWRGIRRDPARSLLIVLLIGLPVALSTYGSTANRTSEESFTQYIMGSADAITIVTPYARLSNYRPGGYYPSDHAGAGRRDPAEVDLAALLPAGSRIAPAPIEYGPIPLDRRDPSFRANLVIADVDEPLHRHQAILDDGRAPAGPDEVLVSRPVAAELGLLDDAGDLRAGATVMLAPVYGPAMTVTGLAYTPSCAGCLMVVAEPGSAVAAAAASAHARGLLDSYGPFVGGFLVDLPAGVSAERLWPALADQGVALTPRELYVNRGQRSSGRIARDAVLFGLWTALVPLPVVGLFALAAFAVGARQQVRDLGLVAANGGSARHVRRIVLAQALVLGGLGGLGAALGVAGGFALVVTSPVWNAVFTDEPYTGPWVFDPWVSAGAVLGGLTFALAAALVPAAAAARMAPVDALAGRFRTSRAARRARTLTEAGLVTTGVLSGLLADRMLASHADMIARDLAQARSTGFSTTTPGDPTIVPRFLIWGGAVLVLIGLVVLTPTLVGWFARVASRLPLAVRLAARDASRHRHRTAPAVGAITVAVGVSVVAAFSIASEFRAAQLQHVPALPPNVLAIRAGSFDASDQQTAVQGAQRAAALLPDGQVHELRVLLRPRAQDGQLPADPWEGLYTGVVWLREHPDLDSPGGFVWGLNAVTPPVVAGDDGLAALVAGGPLDEEARQALADGMVVVFDPRLLDRDGQAVFELRGDSVSQPVLRVP
ncbi:MAG: FtsX-like permease family protein, partial [Egibacteraceae bacterium]